MEYRPLTIRNKDATLLARRIGYSDGIGMRVQPVDDDAEVRALGGTPEEADDSWIAVVDRGHGAGPVSADMAQVRLGRVQATTRRKKRTRTRTRRRRRRSSRRRRRKKRVAVWMPNPTWVY
jgi:hypothetical protein